MAEEPYKNSPLSTGAFPHAVADRLTHTEMENEGTLAEQEIVEGLKRAAREKNQPAEKASPAVRAYLNRFFG